jgi:hypothetical protein
MLVIVRNDSRVHQAKEGEKEKKIEQHFPVTCLLVQFLLRFVPDCPHVMYNKCPYAPCRA